MLLTISTMYLAHSVHLFWIVPNLFQCLIVQSRIGQIVFFDFKYFYSTNPSNLKEWQNGEKLPTLTSAELLFNINRANEKWEVFKAKAKSCIINFLYSPFSVCGCVQTAQETIRKSHWKWSEIKTRERGQFFSGIILFFPLFLAFDRNNFGRPNKTKVTKNVEQTLPFFP